MAEAAGAPVRERIVAVDALRGFDMFWITGGQEVVLGLITLVLGSVPGWVRYQLGHPEWTGFTAWDMIMPTFLFVTGVAMPFSLARRAEDQPLGAVYLKIARRIVLLWILGMIAQGNLAECLWKMDFTRLRLYSNTLQSIASGYLIASVALLHLPKFGQYILCAALLAGYWLLMVLVPFGGHPAGTLEPQANLALYLDKLLLGRFQDGTHYTWILSSLAFGGTVLLGVFAGDILKSPRTQGRKLQVLLIAGVACLIGGQAWALVFPIVKHIWSSSMVLWAAGWDFLALGLFYWVADMKQIRKPLFPFVVIGCNAIVAYMSGEVLINLGEGIVQFFISGAGEGALENAGATHPLARLLGPSIFFCVLWCVLYVMYRKKIFVRL